jgi:hypothetical protein
MASNASDPDRIRSAGSGKTCRSRLIYLKNVRTNETVRTAVIRMITNQAGDNITSYPSTHCP